MACPLCNANNPTYLGPAGAFTWLRCRQCGVDYIIETPPCFVPDEDAINAQWEDE